MWLMASCRSWRYCRRATWGAASGWCWRASSCCPPCFIFPTPRARARTIASSAFPPSGTSSRSTFSPSICPPGRRPFCSLPAWRSRSFLCHRASWGHPMSVDGPRGNPLDLSVIGNCRTAALMDVGGRITWWCFPRFDSDPILSRLLAGSEEKGFCDVVLEGAVASESIYLRNTAIVQTTIRDAAGNALRITDFMPRFKRFERVFNPPQIFRRIEPAAGLPRIKIRVRPTFNYGGPYASRASGSNHLRFAGGADTLRVTTDAALSYIAH